MSKRSIMPPGGTHRAPLSERAHRLGRKAAATVGVLAAILVGLVFLATPASAHHPVIEGKTACVDGKVALTITTTSWTNGDYGQYIAEVDIGDQWPAWGPVPTEGNPPREFYGHIEVTYTPNGGSPQTLALSPTNPAYATLDPTFIYFTPDIGISVVETVYLDESAFPVTLQAQDYGHWKSKDSPASNGSDPQSSALVEAPDGGCTPLPVLM